MPRQRDDDEAERRLQKMLYGAFAGPPTPLKDISTSEGKKRRVGAKAIQSRRRRASRQKPDSAV